MPFPPNYFQERNSRSRKKAQKALDKQRKREEKSERRKRMRPAESLEGTAAEPETEAADG